MVSNKMNYPMLGNLLHYTVRNGSLQAQVIDFDKFLYFSSFCGIIFINITIATMHRLNNIVLDVINDFQSTNNHVEERLCITPPP